MPELAMLTLDQVETLRAKYAALPDYQVSGPLTPFGHYHLFAPQSTDAAFAVYDATEADRLQSTKADALFCCFLIAKLADEMAK
jgi:hypothetical protein